MIFSQTKNTHKRVLMCWNNMNDNKKETVNLDKKQTSTKKENHFFFFVLTVICSDCLGCLLSQKIDLHTHSYIHYWSNRGSRNVVVVVVVVTGSCLI